MRGRHRRRGARAARPARPWRNRIPDESQSSPPFASLLAALHFAAEKHRRQRRKDPEASPYIQHPIAVAEVLARIGGVRDLAVLQAAVLHDTIEDTETTQAELAVRFGDEICNVADVIDAPPEGWSVERRLEYLDWSRRVVDGCRGTSDALERHFDRLIEEGEARIRRAS